MVIEGERRLNGFDYAQTICLMFGAYMKRTNSNIQGFGVVWAFVLLTITALLATQLTQLFSQANRHSKHVQQSVAWAALESNILSAILNPAACQKTFGGAQLPLNDSETPIALKNPSGEVVLQAGSKAFDGLLVESLTGRSGIGSPGGQYLISLKVKATKTSVKITRQIFEREYLVNAQSDSPGTITQCLSADSRTLQKVKWQNSTGDWILSHTAPYGEDRMLLRIGGVDFRARGTLLQVTSMATMSLNPGTPAGDTATRSALKISVCEKNSSSSCVMERPSSAGFYVGEGGRLNIAEAVDNTRVTNRSQVTKEVNVVPGMEYQIELWLLLMSVSTITGLEALPLANDASVNIGSRQTLLIEDLLSPLIALAPN